MCWGAYFWFLLLPNMLSLVFDKVNPYNPIDLGTKIQLVLHAVWAGAGALLLIQVL